MRHSLFLLAFVLFISCSDDDNFPDSQIENLGITIAAYNSGTGLAGDVQFEPAANKPFIEFGDDVDFGGGNIKNNPAFEYLTKTTANVMAIATGQVTKIDFQAADNDFEIAVRSKNFIVFYDHITNHSLNVGDMVSAGDVLGNPGPWAPGVGRTEIQVNDANTDLAHCPFTFFNPATAASYKNKITTLMNEWETFKGDNTIYDQAAFAEAGCKTIQTNP